MASYTIDAGDGETRVRNSEKVSDLFHHFELKGNAAVTGGTVEMQARRPGADDNHLVSVGTYDFSSPTHIDHIGPVTEWVFTVDSIVGAQLLYVTITSTETGKDEAGGGIDPADKAKLDAITSTGSGAIITAAERSKLTAITDTGSGVIMSDAERTKLDGLAFTTEEDELLEGLALGGLYAKSVSIG